MKQCATALVFVGLFSVLGVPTTRAADQQPASPGVARLQILSGMVLERRANVKSFEAWNAPSDPYYVLEIAGDDGGARERKRYVTLRPSKRVSAATLKAQRNKRVKLRGRFVEGKVYKPAGNEAFPIEVQEPLEVDGEVINVSPRPARRGSGFVVTEIIKREK